MNFYFDTCQALVLFLATTKLIQSLKFNRRLAYIITSLNASKAELVGFSIYFMLVYTAFCRLMQRLLYKLQQSVCSAFYLLLSAKLLTFSNYLLVNEEAFAAMLGKFSFDDIVDASWLGALNVGFDGARELCSAMVLLRVHDHASDDSRQHDGHNSHELFHGGARQSAQH